MHVSRKLPIRDKGLNPLGCERVGINGAQERLPQQRLAQVSVSRSLWCSMRSFNFNVKKESQRSVFYAQVREPTRSRRRRRLFAPLTSSSDSGTRLMQRQLQLQHPGHTHTMHTRTCRKSLRDSCMRFTLASSKRHWL
jgi:hypothetical protein